MQKILGILGKIGKGFATVAGVVLGIGGVAFGGGDQLTACLKMVQQQPAAGVALIGVLLAVFGVGRKAGWIGGGTA